MLQAQDYTKIIPLVTNILQHLLVEWNVYAMGWNVGVVQFIISQTPDDVTATFNWY
jgi:hypothetical protein